MYAKLEMCALFKGLNASHIDALLQQSFHQLKKLKIGEYLVYAGQEVKSQYFIIEGSVKGEMVDFSGKSIKIEDIEAPRLLAPAFLFGSNNRFPVNIVANSNAIILAIPKNEFVKLLQKNAKVLENYLDIISNRAQFLSQKIKFLSFRSIKGKIAQYILEIVNKTKSESIQLPLSQVQLAEMFGVTRPSLGRAIRELHQEGIIEASGKRINIINKAMLSELLN